MTALARRIQELQGLHIRLHVGEGNAVTLVDGICQGIDGECVVLSPSSLGERTDVLLARVYAVTQLPGEFAVEPAEDPSP
jgi:hypothetical protein